MHSSGSATARLRYALSWFVYGAVLIASGCYRFVSRPDGEKGLYFGLAMGAFALAAGLLIHRGRWRIGHALGFLSVVCVTGWFVYEGLIRDGGSHEQRLLIVAVLSVWQGTRALAQLVRRPGT